MSAISKIGPAAAMMTNATASSPKRARQVLIVNAFGVPDSATGATDNVGDWALIASAIAMVREAWPSCDVVLMPQTRPRRRGAPDRRLLAALGLPDDTTWLSVVDPLVPAQTIAPFATATTWQRARIAAWTAASAVAGETILRLARFQSGTGHQPDPLSSSAAIRAADVVVFRSGNLTCGARDARRAIQLHRQMAVIRMAETLGIPTLILGSTVAVPGTRLAKWLILDPLRQATHVWAREPVTFQALLSAGFGNVSAGADIAFVRPRQDIGPPAKGVVAVNTLSLGEWRNATGRNAAEHAEMLVGLTRLLRTLLHECPELRLKLIPHEPSEHGYRSDVAALERIAIQLDDPGRVGVAPALQTPSQAVAAYGGCAAAIGMRYHGFVFAALAGTPMVGLDVGSPKLRGIASLLGLPSFAAGTAGEQAALFSLRHALEWDSARRFELQMAARRLGSETAASFVQIARSLVGSEECAR